MKVIFTLAVVLVIVYGEALNTTVFVPQTILEAVNKNISVNIFITLKDRPIDLFNHFKHLHLSREQKLKLVGRVLKDHAKSKQKNILNLLYAFPQISYKSYWITNQIYIKNVNAVILKRLITLPEILKVTSDGSIKIEQPYRHFTNLVRRPGRVEWGVKRIGAEEVWALGINGTGVIVANIDTGVRGTHSSLRDNYIGDYGWYDPYYKTEVPTDDNGHGTHTMGTIAGRIGFGVAPGAKWMACKGCTSTSCDYETLLDCAQFMACPTRPDGTGSDCTKAPRIVSNSWSGIGGDDFYDDVLKVWYELGIIAVFSNGNTGNSCRTAKYPADSLYTPVVAVGSTTEEEELSSFSSVGPSVHGRIKPDIAAPGSYVVSAYHTGDDAFTDMSGTSMATPHVSGVLALILQSHPNFNYEQATSMLYSGATHTVVATGTCGDIPQNQFPNNYVGYGRTSASKSLINKNH